VSGKNTNSGQIDKIRTRLCEVRLSDRFRLTRKFNQLRNLTKYDKSKWDALNSNINISIQTKINRIENKPESHFDELLPINQHINAISNSIITNQVIIICGETGSGKTTQLPKLCLESGRGIDGYIGHTQPRRLAAKSVARRIAEELESDLGNYVGYKIRTSGYDE